MAFMRHNNNGRRHNNNFHRNRNNSGGNNGGNQQNQGQGQRRVNRVNHVFESNGPDGRIRGTAQQIVEKYSTLARDAAGSGDKVLSLNYLQHAEHYQRLLNEIMEENAAIEREREQFRQQQAQQPDVSAEAAAEGFVAQQEGGASQPQQPREPRDNREQRPPRREQRQERQPHGDENELPSFLQVPITTGEKKSDDSETPRSARTPRPVRRAPAAATPAESSEE